MFSLRVGSAAAHVIFFVLAFGMLACSQSAGQNGEAPANATEDTIPEGTSRFVYNEYEPLADKPLTVWTYNPSAESVADLPIVFVMHGFGRNGKEYRNEWIEYAEQYSFLLVVPTFVESYYPRSQGYNLGNVITPGGEAVPEAEWGFSAIEALFDHVKSITGSDETAYDLFGHSAGSQFVHRFHLLKPNNRARMSIAANAGWYTMPNFETEFPYGLNGSPGTQESLDAGLTRDLVVLLGEEDNDPNASSLRTTPEANAQGAHRFERGQTFYEAGQQAAERSSVSYGWRIQTVPGVGHESAKMAEAAAEILFGSPPSGPDASTSD